jgi:hypothetical protein
MKELILEIVQNKPGEPFVLRNQETKEEIKNIEDPEGAYSIFQVLKSGDQNEYYNEQTNKVFKMSRDNLLNELLLLEGDVVIHKNTKGTKDFLEYHSKTWYTSRRQINNCLNLGRFIKVYPGVAKCCECAIERL